MPFHRSAWLSLVIVPCVLLVGCQTSQPAGVAKPAPSAAKAAAKKSKPAKEKGANPKNAGSKNVAEKGGNWAPADATGEPNTLADAGGDYSTAWASLTEDDQDEWLQLTYKNSVTPTAILVYETFNPGALIKVTAFDGDREKTLWEGKDPVQVQNGKGIAQIPVSPSFPVKKVKLYIASTQVPGWNEIDAVGLRSADGSIEWAESAIASSTYADDTGISTSTPVWCCATNGQECTEATITSCGGPGGFVLQSEGSKEASKVRCDTVCRKRAP
jgi:hypothetical protein